MSESKNSTSERTSNGHTSTHWSGSIGGTAARSPVLTQIALRFFTVYKAVLLGVEFIIRVLVAGLDVEVPPVVVDIVVDDVVVVDAVVVVVSAPAMMPRCE